MEKFSYEANGYNRNEVNQFISDVITQTEGIISKCHEQSSEIERLKSQLNRYNSMEDTLKNAVMRAETTANDIKQVANREAEMIITNAKHNASRIVNEALLKANHIENKTEILKNNTKIFKRKLELIMEQQKAVVEEIEVLELD